MYAIRSYYGLLNAWRFFKFNNSMDLVLLGVWGWLFITMLAYWLYNKLEITQKLWAKRIWFSQNDVLHIGLILWVLYITAVVTRITSYNVCYTKLLRD